MICYISAVSFEDRCRALPQRLPQASGHDRFILFDFEGYDDVAPYVFNRSEIVNLVESKGYKVEFIHCSESSPLQTSAEVSARLLSAIQENIIFDISVMPRNFIFSITKAIADSNVSSKIQYSRPLEYGVDLSRGVKAIQTIPGFEGENSLVGDTSLAIILGFEGYKALYAWERVGPNKVYALFGSPPYEQRFLDISRVNNQDLFKLGSSLEEKYIHTYDVLAARRCLQEIYDEVMDNSENNNFVLCPLGTKLQTLAAFAFAYKNRKASVVYVSSLSYYVKSYSKGYHPSYSEYSLEDIIDI